ncbi:nucleotidyltransferase domain-containing protein [Asaia siamensis]
MRENVMGRVAARKSWPEGLAQLVLDLRRVVPDEERILLHGSAVHGADPGDVDLAMIVRDGTDRFEGIRSMARLLADHTVATTILHTCFPIEQAACSTKASQYVRNVLADGSELKNVVQGRRSGALGRRCFGFTAGGHVYGGSGAGLGSPPHRPF